MRLLKLRAVLQMSPWPIPGRPSNVPSTYVKVKLMATARSLALNPAFLRLDQAADSWACGCVGDQSAPAHVGQTRHSRPQIADGISCVGGLLSEPGFLPPLRYLCLLS